MEKKEWGKSPSSYKAAVLLIIVTLISYVVWFAFMQDQTLALKTETWGQFGDFFGGVSNPIIALLTLYWVMRAVKLQSEELRETTKTLKEAAAAQEESARTQKGSAETQIINTSLTALTAQLRILQSDIDQLLSERSYYANVRPDASGTYRGLGGAAIGDIGITKALTGINGDIETKKSEREFVKHTINIYMDKVAPHLGVADFVKHLSK